MNPLMNSLMIYLIYTHNIYINSLEISFNKTSSEISNEFPIEFHNKYLNEYINETHNEFPNDPFNLQL